MIKVLYPNSVTPNPCAIVPLSVPDLNTVLILNPLRPIMLTGKGNSIMHVYYLRPTSINDYGKLKRYIH